jgi:hypothetical protein
MPRSYDIGYTFSPVSGVNGVKLKGTETVSIGYGRVDHCLIHHKLAKSSTSASWRNLTLKNTVLEMFQHSSHTFVLTHFIDTHSHFLTSQGLHVVGQ